MAKDKNGDNPQERPDNEGGASKSSARKATSDSKKSSPGAGTRGRKKLDKAEDTVEAVTRKAKSTAKKVAAAVSGTVREIADKMAARKPRATAKKVDGASVTKKTTAATAAGSLGRKSKSRTKTDELLAETPVRDLPNSESIPDESKIADESATDVREHFFHDQHTHAGPPPPQAPRDLPDEYGDTKLVLLVRDPEWVYAYWEINDATRNELNLPREGHKNRLVLRLFKISGRQWPEEAAHYFFDVDVPQDAKSWYVKLPEANESWCAELGIIDDEQNYIPVCRSNAFYTPRNSISDHVDSEWMTVEESFEKITRMSSASLEAQLRGESQTASESILKHIHRQLTGVLHGERAALSSGLFSSDAAQPIGTKDFWLQVHTELILYGATEPDARVTVQGQPVELNSDGTFSIRFALPDGEQVLEVRAVNRDNDREESITPVVQRTTH